MAGSNVAGAYRPASRPQARPKIGSHRSGEPAVVAARGVGAGVGFRLRRSASGSAWASAAASRWRAGLGPASATRRPRPSRRHAASLPRPWPHRPRPVRSAARPGPRRPPSTVAGRARPGSRPPEVRPRSPVRWSGPAAGPRRDPPGSSGSPDRAGLRRFRARPPAHPHWRTAGPVPDPGSGRRSRRAPPEHPRGPVARGGRGTDPDRREGSRRVAVPALGRSAPRTGRDPGCRRRTPRSWSPRSPAPG